MDNREIDMNFLMDLLREEKELTDQDKQNLLDLNKTFFYFDRSDDIRFDDNGEFIISYGNTEKRVKSLGRFEKTIDVLCRLKALKYISSINYDSQKKFYPSSKSMYQIMQYYLTVLKDIDRLKNQYGDSAYRHIDEIEHGFQTEMKQTTSTPYEMLKRNYQNYLKTLTPQEASDLQIATQIYGGIFFIAINEIESIDDFETRSSSELIRQCNQNQDFKEVFHHSYQSLVKTLNQGKRFRL